ncbi:MAG: formate transporter FocA [Alphaproteobacteria bacterium]
MPDSHEDYGIDARLPPEMALKAEQAGAAKAGRDAISLLVLSILAGAFIAFGAVFMTVVLTGSAGSLPFGVARLLGGLVFSLGLILVVIGGAELFTGDNLMVMAWANRTIKTRALMRAWAIIYFGNLIGAVGTAVLVFLSGQSGLAGGGVGKTALTIAGGKVDIPFFEAVVLGILCNVLVCLAVWLSLSARTVVGKIFAIVPPIAAFVAAGFEHSIANMYFFPIALMIKEWAPDPFWQAIGAAPKDYSGITIMAALGNIAPVTIGNIIGGGVLVGAIYWFVYLRHR